MKKELDEKQLAQAIDQLYKEVVKQLPDKLQVAVVGIRTRGQILAERIVKRLKEDFPKRKFQYGVLDITFYRDDLARRRGVPLVKATEIDFDIDDTWVLLVDDVLESGRSIRAALGALQDFGRPRVIRLGVLVDRGGRELPISADFVGKKLKVPDNLRVQVRLKDTDSTEGVFLINK